MREPNPLELYFGIDTKIQRWISWIKFPLRISDLWLNQTRDPRALLRRGGKPRALHILFLGLLYFVSFKPVPDPDYTAGWFLWALSALIYLIAPTIWHRCARGWKARLNPYRCFTKLANLMAREVTFSFQFFVMCSVILVRTLLLWQFDPDAMIYSDIEPLTGVRRLTNLSILTSILPFSLYLLLIPVMIFSRGFHVARGAERQRQLRKLLEHTNLHATRPEPPARGVAFIRYFTITLTGYPHLIAFAAAFAVLLLPTGWTMESRELLLVAGGLAILLSVSASLSSFSDLPERLHHLLFGGGQFLVSALVIVLGFGRFVEFDYVRVTIESAHLTVLCYISLFYLLFFIYESWLNDFASHAFLRNFGVNKDVSFLRYWYREEGRKLPRVLQLHGASHVASLDPTNRDFQIFTREELMDRLQVLARPELLTGKRKLSLFNRIRSLRINKTFYFGSAYAAPLIIVAIAVFGQIRKQENALVTYYEGSGNTGTKPFNLAQAVFHARNSTPIAIAAAGGGTRAALYTAGVLKALDDINRSQDVVLLSGISGGGVALAYFAEFRKELLSHDAVTHKQEWDHFFETMRAEYIQTVITDLSFFRIAGRQSTSKLLAESFYRCFYAKHIHSNRRCEVGLDKRTPRTFGEIDSIGIILNASIAGHLACGVGDLSCAGQYWALSETERSLQWIEWVEKNLDRAGSWKAGNYYAFSNIDPKYLNSRKSNLPEKPTQFPDYEFFDYEVRPFPGMNQVQLYKAAAIQANFPPVFPNVAVDEFHALRNQNWRYWLTDGGTSENKGTTSLLLALREALKEETNLSSSQGLILIVADGGSPEMDYTLDRGIEVLTVAKEKYGTELMYSLANLINAEARTKGFAGNFVRIVYLPIPATLRMRGGVGTNWTLPSRIYLTNPQHRSSAEAKEKRIAIDATCAVSIFTSLRNPNSVCPENSETIKRFLNSTMQDETHSFSRRWAGLEEMLFAADSEPGRTRTDR